MIRPALIVPLLTAAVLTACSPGAPEPEDRAGEAAVSENATGISEDALAANQTIGALGVLARQLENTNAAVDLQDTLEEMETLLEENASDLPDGLAADVRGDIQSISDALEAEDTRAARAAAQALILRLRETAPQGGEI